MRLIRIIIYVALFLWVSLNWIWIAGISSKSASDDITKWGTESTDISSPKLRTLHVIQCLAGNATGFINEWEVNLKSILVYAPLDAHMHIHIIADEKAAAAINNRLDVAELHTATWRNKLYLTITNVESRMDNWLNILKVFLQSHFDTRIGIGGYFRLFAHEIILKYISRSDWNDLRTAVYMDTDVVVISGLNSLIEGMDKVVDNRGRNDNGGFNYPLWTWGGNSGFMTLNLIHFDQFWTLLRLAIARDAEVGVLNGRWISDQSLLQLVETYFNHEVGVIPEQWNIHIGHGYQKSPQLLYDRKVDAGILHFTGIDTGDSYFSDEGIIKFCHCGKGCQGDAENDRDKIDRSWGRADHYVKLPWHWVKYQGGAYIFLY